MRIVLNALLRVLDIPCIISSAHFAYIVVTWNSLRCILIHFSLKTVWYEHWFVGRCCILLLNNFSLILVDRFKDLEERSDHQVSTILWLFRGMFTVE